MLFHLGAIWRLGETGWLKRLKRVSSVSGGSIIAATLGLRWTDLEFDDEGFLNAESLERELTQPVRALAGRTIDVPSVVSGIAIPGVSVGQRVSAAYRKHLYGNATLQDLPSDSRGPRFVINATNLQSGVLWRFSRPYARDYRVGKIANPEIALATAVAASSAFPPVLAPVRLRFRDEDYEPGTGDDLQKAPFTTRPVLGDGGIYDNLGLQTVSSFQTVLISDGGGAMQPDPGGLGLLKGWRWRDWGSQSFRVLHVIDNQVRNLRKREAIAAYMDAPGSTRHRDGAYWGIRSHIADYGLADAVDFPPALSKRLAAIPTRLEALSPQTQEQLINWGYAICDTAMRTWVDTELPMPRQLPYPSRV